MVDSGAAGDYFDDAVIRDLKNRIQDYVHLTTPPRFSLPGELCWTVRREACCKALWPTTTAIKFSFGSISFVVVPRIGRNHFSVMTAAKKGIATILDYENPRMEGFSVTVPLWSESGDLYSFVLDLSADRYGAKELAKHAVAKPQVRHRQLGHLHPQSPDILHKQDGSEITLKGACRGLRRLRRGESSTARSHKVKYTIQIKKGTAYSPYKKENTLVHKIFEKSDTLNETKANGGTESC